MTTSCHKILIIVFIMFIKVKSWNLQSVLACGFCQFSRGGAFFSWGGPACFFPRSRANIPDSHHDGNMPEDHHHHHVHHQPDDDVQVPGRDSANYTCVSSSTQVKFGQIFNKFN